MDLHAIILAGGESKRFGGCKLLAKYKGKSLFEHCIMNVMKTPVNTVSIVVGAYADELNQIIKQTSLMQSSSVLRSIKNNNWQEGLGSSIAIGAGQLPPASAKLLVLADQVLVTDRELNHLITHWEQQPETLVYSKYQNTFGVPAIFPPRFHEQLCSLSGNSGAKKIIQNETTRVGWTDIPQAACDIDTKVDLERIQNDNV